jgi:hypothetical protein
MNSPDPRSVSFSVEGVSGTVRPLRTGRDKLYRGIVLSKLYSALRSRGGEEAELIGYRACETFATLCVCAQDVTGFAFPSISSNEQQIAEAFAAWLDLPAAAYDALFDAHDAANAPTNDPDLLPPSMVPDEKKRKLAKSAQTTAASGMQG